VDFAHTSGALGKVLSTLRPLVKGRLVCLIGCGGDRDTSKRPEMGAIATDIADTAVFTADNSRSERTEDIIDEMIAGVTRKTPDAYVVEPDRRAAIRRAIELAGGPDSMAVICGRGCEKYLKIGGTRTPFDDRVVTRQVMNEIPLTQRKSA
jgi:UDP-N-acetylmuramoyl-L-alanyl-D-glutamate--2,6-diaminopimelate ligase